MGSLSNKIQQLKEEKRKKYQNIRSGGPHLNVVITIMSDVPDDQNVGGGGHETKRDRPAQGHKPYPVDSLPYCRSSHVRLIQVRSKNAEKSVERYQRH